MPDTKPQDQVLSDVVTQASDSTATIAPTAQPPVLVQAVSSFGADGASTTTWLNNQKVAALWSIAENRNSWAYLGGKWVKLANNSDTAVVALTMLASHGKQMQTVVNCRQEADGMIHEIYAW